ncbi:hypothetical protein X740_33205 [Mesorhizobium sp. LNHC221B00]|uniref:hypothetical protein n=1 Tax=Mesorhizobium sp. LNHC221B00 TaxID=1287233 RepID=UPI0003CE06E7|nr:hypothetical protein [Mesorhizobium sp. LNHC221B00]ESY72522.1 hypothetical protein X740_33205 [Mesorhizobium sp. LNHC221B00]
MDPREAILARLLIVAGEVDTTLSPIRNESDPAAANLPAVILFDGEETARDTDPRGRTALTTPRLVDMTPEVQFRLKAKDDDVGTKLNLLRAKLIKAVMSDAQLLASTANGQAIRYQGSMTATERGRSMEGGIGVAFTFTYAMRPEALVDTVTA